MTAVIVLGLAIGILAISQMVIVKTVTRLESQRKLDRGSIDVHKDYIDYIVANHRGYIKVLNDAISEQRDCNFNVDTEIKANAMSIEKHSLAFLHTKDSHNSYMKVLSGLHNDLRSDFNAANQIAVTCEECGCAVLKHEAVRGKSVIESGKLSIIRHEHNDEYTRRDAIREVYYCKAHAPEEDRNIERIEALEEQCGLSSAMPIS